MLFDLLNKRFNTKHWDKTNDIPQEKLDYITDCLLKTPCKMAIINYKIVVITDSPAGKEIKDWLFYEHTWNANGVRAGQPGAEGHKDYNGQYLAPIVIAWLNPLESPDEGIINNQRMLFPDYQRRENNIFISNTVAMLSAEEQGLDTGFGSCHDEKELANKLGYPGFSCPIVLGIGYAKDMTTDIENMNLFIPVPDPAEPEKTLGTCFVNLPAHHPKPTRLMRPTKDQLDNII